MWNDKGVWLEFNRSQVVISNNQWDPRCHKEFTYLQGKNKVDSAEINTQNESTACTLLDCTSWEAQYLVLSAIPVKDTDTQALEYNVVVKSHGVDFRDYLFQFPSWFSGLLCNSPNKWESIFCTLTVMGNSVLLEACHFISQNVLLLCFGKRWGENKGAYK